MFMWWNKAAVAWGGMPSGDNVVPVELGETHASWYGQSCSVLRPDCFCSGYIAVPVSWSWPELAVPVTVSCH